MARNDRLALLTSLTAMGALVALAGAAAPAAGAARSVQVTPVSGRVLVAVGGHRPVRLRATRAIRVGSVVDATRGALVIASPRRGRGPATADVTGGRFRVSLPRRGLTRLALVGPRCPAAGAATIYRPVTKVHVPSRRRHRHARSSAAAIGTFESVGRYQTAANDGAATWETQDSCRATTVAQDAGAVATETRGPTSRPLTALGGSGTAAGAGAARTLSGYRVTRRVWTVACSHGGRPPAIGGYCEALLAEETSNGFVAYVPGLFAKTAAGTFDLCIDRPAAAADCRTWPFSSPAPDGFRDGLIACTAPQRGTYRFRWSVGGTPLAVQLPAFDARHASKFNGPCSGRFGAPYSPLGRRPEPLPPDAQSVNRYELPTDASLWSESLFVIATDTKGEESVQGVVYGDAGGAPGALLGTTSSVPIRRGRDDGYQDLEFSPALRLPAGAYWIGVVTHGTPNLVFSRFEDNADLAYGTSLVPGVPNDPFGPFATKHRRISLHVDYDVTP